jgi:hypothetical protein
MLASAAGHETVVRLLLEHSAAPNVTASDGTTALMQATMNGHDLVTKALIDKHANVNMVTKAGMTALMWAAQTGRLEIVKQLLAGGANVDAEDGSGATALSFAKANEHKAIVDLIMESRKPGDRGGTLKGAAAGTRNIAAKQREKDVTPPMSQPLPAVASTTTTRRAPRLAVAAANALGVVRPLYPVRAWATQASLPVAPGKMVAGGSRWKAERPQVATPGSGSRPVRARVPTGPAE